MAATHEHYPIYYFCPDCDWRGSDKDLKHSFFDCPVCFCRLETDRAIMDEMEEGV